LSRSDTFHDKSNEFSCCSEDTLRTSSSDSSSCWDDTSDPEADQNLDPITLCKRRRLERVRKMKLKRSHKPTISESYQYSSIHSRSSSFSSSSCDKSHRRRLSNRESAERSRMKKNLLIDSLTVRNCEYFVELQDLLAENERLKTLLSTSESTGVLLQSTLCDGFDSLIEEPLQRSGEIDQQSFEGIFDGFPVQNSSVIDATLHFSHCELDSMCFDWTIFD